MSFDSLVNFGKIPPVPQKKEVLDRGIQAGKKRARVVKENAEGTYLQKVKVIERERVMTTTQKMEGIFQKITNSFPAVDRLPLFYIELIKCTVGRKDLKQALAAVSWAEKQIVQRGKLVQKSIARARTLDRVYGYKKEFYGRISSVVRQIEPRLMYLEAARREMKVYPTILTENFTVALTGFPNVGKSTLLNELTPSTVPIGSYPFTTTQILMGMLKRDYHMIQILDTPGTLNRFEKMNVVEKQAYLAMEYVADLIVYLFDLTEMYPMDHQERLYKSLDKYNKPIIIYLSKTDIIDKETLAGFDKPALTNSDELKKLIWERYFLWLSEKKQLKR